jgi:hypothetical protein
MQQTVSGLLFYSRVKVGYIYFHFPNCNVQRIIQCVSQHLLSVFRQTYAECTAACHKDVGQHNTKCISYYSKCGEGLLYILHNESSDSD